MTCQNCAYENKAEVRFCGNCGRKILAEKVQVSYEKPLTKVYALYFAILLYLVILNFASFESSYIYHLVTDIIFALIVLVFFFLDFKASKKLLVFRGLKRNLVIRVLIMAPVLAVGVHYFAYFLNQNVFNSRSTSYYEAYLDSPAPLFFSLLSIAVFPAFFEELAFRGVLFNETLKIMGLRATILVTSILFTLLHFSVISSIWLLPGGLIFGYLRARHKTLAYGMLGHCLYNASIVILELILP